MKIVQSELVNTPETMNKEQFRKVCHISKSTALFLLETKLIPCENTGKKTRCYRIKKSDVIEFIKERENNPIKYLPPKLWYSRGRFEKSSTMRVYPNEMVTKEKMRKYYSECLSDYPDLLRTKDISQFTGYVRQTIAGWVDKGELKYITRTNTYHVPKVFLIEFLCSDYYDKIIRKTQKHLCALWEMSK